MDDDKLEVKLVRLEEKVANLVIQVNRIISHVESEQRVTGNISKRVDMLQHTLERIEKNLDKKDDTHKWRLDTFIAIVSVVANMVLGLMVVLNK